MEKRLFNVLITFQQYDVPPSVYALFHTSTGLLTPKAALAALAEAGEIDAELLEDLEGETVEVFGPINLPVERGELQELLLRPDTDDATYILRQVYVNMGLPIPSFLEVA